ncbi:hypothetical protein ACFXPA_47430 [Amycolatopsis sp. NPDC059090]|uniref:hypothetical protein n=1 Tax=Amycolatopsis sp. NPDC059090 TaxID=3346723 RepID=UPI00367119B3
MSGPVPSLRFEESLLAASDDGLAAVSELVLSTVEHISKGMRNRESALPAGRPGQVADVVAAALADGVLPDRGMGRAGWRSFCTDSSPVSSI